MESRNFYNEILTDHNLHPVHKEDIPDANLVLEGLNPSCGDHIWLKLEAGALQDISHMPARVKCAVLGWHTMEELLKEEK